MYIYRYIVRYAAAIRHSSLHTYNYVWIDLICMYVHIRLFTSSGMRQQIVSGHTAVAQLEAAAQSERGLNFLLFYHVFVYDVSIYKHLLTNSPISRSLLPISRSLLS